MVKNNDITPVKSYCYFELEYFSTGNVMSVNGKTKCIIIWRGDMKVGERSKGKNKRKDGSAGDERDALFPI